MSIGSIIGILGLLVSALGGLWYWWIMQLAVAFAGTTMANSLDRTAKYAITIVCFGLVLSLIGWVVGLLGKNEDV
jgi:hypothetical protein